MKSRTLTLITAVAVLAVLAFPIQLIAQDTQDPQHKHHHYKLIDMGTFGGPQSYTFRFTSYTSAVGLNNHGTLAGFADTPTLDPFLPFCFVSDCYVSHAFQWWKGVRTDLGVLPGGLSSASTFISANGLTAGFSQNGKIDPLVPGFPEVRAVLWNDGKIINLGTLEGGSESVANAVNSHGQVVGGATNTIPDSNAMTLSAGLSNFFPGLPYQTRAFLWQDGVMHDLGTLGGTDAQAVLINEAGQVAGWSYISSAPGPCPFSAGDGIPLTTGSFLWDKDNGMVDLGSLGGACTIAEDLNQRGQVVGISHLTGDQVIDAFIWDRATGLTDLGTLGGTFTEAAAINDHGEAVGGSHLPGDLQSHAVLWSRGRIIDLGTLDGASCAFADSINARGQVVGASPCDVSAHAFLWENDGPMVDLNTLVSSRSGISLVNSVNINARGEIAVLGFAGNNVHSVLLIPCDENHPGTEGCDYNLVDAPAAPQTSYRPLPPSLMRRMNRHHLPGPAFGPRDELARTRTERRRNK